jgi:hypothetical protein
MSEHYSDPIAARFALADREVNEAASTVEEAAQIYARHGADESDALLLARLHFEHHRRELKRLGRADADLPDLWRRKG